MSFLAIENLTKQFGSFKAVDDLTLNVGRSKVCTLLGPSGCGKTTTLRCIAGLEVADTGTISLEGKPLSSIDQGVFVPPERRNLGMVFQSYALWPHKSVFDNVALGLRIQGRPRAEIRDKVAGVLDLVGMPGTEERFPAQLSGGQQQRVALARALALEPQCLLFDEPLSNLDLILRERMRFEIRELLVKQGITSVYVTHDQTEAMVISDHICIMNAGRIEQEGQPSELYGRPSTRFVAEFLGRTNLFPLDQSASNPETGQAVADNGLRFRTLDTRRMAAGGDMMIAFRPEAVRLVNGGGGADNVFRSRVLNTTFLGATTQVELEVDGCHLHALLVGQPNLTLGESIDIGIDAGNVLLIAETVENMHQMETPP